MKKVVFLNVWLFLAFPLLGGEIVLSGTYQGKAVYVQNPFNHSQNSFCTREVFVNDRKLFEAPRISAFKIDLSHLKVNDLVVIRITFGDGCKPRVVNPHVIHSPTDFKFITAQSDNHSLSWTTAGESEGGQFIIERYDAKERKWQTTTSMLARGSAETNQYAISITHEEGENRYRLRYEGSDGTAVYSVEVTYTSNPRSITFYPRVVTHSLHLSDSVSYTITDYHGKVAKEGEGKEIIVLDLRPGEYYLNIENQKEKFVKK